MLRSFTLYSVFVAMGVIACPRFAAAQAMPGNGTAPNGIYAPNSTFYVTGNGGAAGNLHPTSAIAPVAEGTSGMMGGEGYGCGYGGWAGGGVGHGSRLGDMPQHYPYDNPMHGYYYFHPYHHSHVVAHQEFVARFGVDPRNPYCNDFFKVVYAEYRASQFERTPERVAIPPGIEQFPVPAK